MNISLINYKIFSGKYILLETNRKGKEYKYNYFGDILIFKWKKKWKRKGILF